MQLARVAAVLVSQAIVTLGLVACVTPLDELTEDERRELAETDEDLAGEIAVSRQALKDCDYDKAKATVLGDKARSGSGARSQSRCYNYVKRHLRSAGFTLPSELSSMAYGNSAADFIKFANHKPAQLAAMKLQPVSAGVAEKLPKGVVMVWPRGTCGYSKKHGHIEVVCNDDGTQACSDFKGRVRRSPKCVPTLYAPKGTCTPADSCDGKADGYYCSSINTASAYGCRGGQRVGASYCSAGKKCGTAGSKATLSGGTLQCK